MEGFRITIDGREVEARAVPREERAPEKNAVEQFLQTPAGHAVVAGLSALAAALVRRYVK